MKLIVYTRTLGPSVRSSSHSWDSVVAGSGTCGYGGDGGPAASALLDGPLGIAFDSAGNLYIADTNNQRVRRVDSRGVMTTIAGVGTIGFSGDDGLASQAETGYPIDVGISNSGGLYIAESFCACAAPTSAGRLRLVRLSSGIITTVAYSGSVITW